MLKNLKSGLVAFICLSSSIAAKAQKSIEQGTITYAVEYDLPADQQSMAAMLPSEYKVNFKDNLSQFKMDMGMFAVNVIYNSKSKETLTLTDVPMQNKKIAVKMNEEQSAKMKEMQGAENDFDVTPTSETKKISGYNCTRYHVKDKTSGHEYEVWATKDVQIPVTSLTSDYIKIPGLPVQFNVSNRGMKAKLTLKEVKADDQLDLNMNVPDGYENMSFEDLLQQMGG